MAIFDFPYRSPLPRQLQKEKGSLASQTLEDHQALSYHFYDNDELLKFPILWEHISYFF